MTGKEPVESSAQRRAGLLAVTIILFVGPPAVCRRSSAPHPVQPESQVRIVTWTDGTGVPVDVVAGQVLVQFKANVPSSVRHALHQEIGCRLLHEYSAGLDTVAFELGRLGEILKRLESDDRVVYAEPNIVYRPLVEPDDPLWDQQWGPQLIRCPEAWDSQTGNEGAVIAVIDTGVNRNHGDLDDNYADGWDFVDNDDDPDDHVGHGTAVTGVAAAETDNGIGMAGVGFDCRYAAYRVGDSWFSLDHILAAIDHAMASGALVNSMSFGSPYPSQALNDILDAAYEAGMVNVAAVGATGDTTLYYPAAYDNVIAVAASNRDDTRCVFSGYGDWVDVAAPGMEILTTLGDGYGVMSGTSLACPHVSGAVALLYAKAKNRRLQEHADRIRRAIQETAVPVPGDYVRYGRIDVKAGLDRFDPLADECFGVLYGDATPGTSGEPVVELLNPPAHPGNRDCALYLTNVWGQTPGFLLISLETDDLTFGTGTKINVGFPLLLLFGFVTEGPPDPGVGTSEFPYPIPDDPAVVGLTVYNQFLTMDAAGPDGWAATKGLAIEVCDL